MIILDTNVLSALMRQLPDRAVVSWLDRQPRASIWTTSITALEIQYGLQILPAGKRRTALLRAFGTLLDTLISQRIASFDADAAQYAAELMAARHAKGRPCELRDTMIAGIALANHATLATRNVAHFPELASDLVNPWET